MQFKVIWFYAKIEMLIHKKFGQIVKADWARRNASCAEREREKQKKSGKVVGTSLKVKPNDKPESIRP